MTKIRFNGNASITGNNTIGEPDLTPVTNTSTGGRTQTITGNLSSGAIATTRIELKSAKAGSQSTLLKAEGEVFGNHIILKDMNATGGASFNV